MTTMSVTWAYYRLDMETSCLKREPVMLISKAGFRSTVWCLSSLLTRYPSISLYKDLAVFNMRILRSKHCPVYMTGNEEKHRHISYNQILEVQSIKSIVGNERPTIFANPQGTKVSCIDFDHFSLVNLCLL